MHPILILAHGALGPYDELIFLAVGLVFFGMMILSWLRSRSVPADMTDKTPATIDDSTTPPDPQRFRLD